MTQTTETSPTASPDPLGPVTFSEAQALRNPDIPDLPTPRRHRFMTWEAQASTPEAKALLGDIAASIGISLGDQPGEPRKRGPKPKKTEAEVLEAFVGDLLRNAKTGHWSAQPMTTAAFAPPCPVGATTFRRVLKAMERAGFVQIAPGYKKREDLGDSAVTKFRPTERLFQRAEAHGITWRKATRHFTRPDTQEAKTRDPVAIVSLEDKATTLPLPDTEEARARVAEVEAFNAFVSRFRIQSGSPEAPTTHHPVFQRRYHGDFRYHGRLYDRGNSYQGLASPDNPRADPEESRASLTIEGEAVAELDVHASGLTIVHALAGVPLPQRADLYALDGLPRAAVKAWVRMYLGNGGASPRNWDPDEEPEIRAVSRKAIRTAVLEAYPFLRDLPALLDVEESPKLVSHVLAALEADAVLGAVFDLQGRGILALPIHDGILVPRQVAGIAREALETHYERVSGIKPIVRTKVGTGRPQDAS